MKHLKLYLLAATAFLLCAVAVACQVNLNKSPSENSSDTATTSSPILSDGFRVDLYEKKVENVLHARLLTATEEERINVVVIYDTPSQEQIDAVIEERWQIMRSIQSGSIPSQETTYTLPTEGDGIRNRIALERDVQKEMFLRSAYRITDEFFPDGDGIRYISAYSPQIFAEITREQIGALTQSPYVLRILDGDSRTGTTTY